MGTVKFVHLILRETISEYRNYLHFCKEIRNFPHKPIKALIVWVFNGKYLQNHRVHLGYSLSIGDRFQIRLLNKWVIGYLQAGADAVKLEGATPRVCALIRRLTEAGIPVLAHVGMTPQSVNEYGGFKKQGKTREAADRVMADAKAVEEAGAFAVTLECIPSELAAEITAALKIVTVGIGAGPVCDAQWLVMHDLLGLNEKAPSFVKQYAHLASDVRNAFAAYVNEVANGTFPN